MAKQLELSCPQCTHSNPLNTKTCQKCSWQLVDNLLESTRLANNKDFEQTIGVSDTEYILTKNEATELINFSQDLDHFKILEILGKGGMGAVYHARDKVLQRDVAIKILRSDLEKSKSDLLLDEARMASKINHPNIVTIYDFESFELSLIK